MDKRQFDFKGLEKCHEIEFELDETIGLED
jgi:hypothetical protein